MKPSSVAGVTHSPNQMRDVYPKTPYRISKDQNGSYGTANNYGQGFVSRILRFLVKNSIDFPPLYSVYVCGELINSGHNVSYSKELDLEKNYDLYILPSSIVCHETEIEHIKILNKFDSCCYSGIGYTTFEKNMQDSINVLGQGRFVVYLDETHSGHIISDFSLKLIEKNQESSKTRVYIC